MRMTQGQLEVPEDELDGLDADFEVSPEGFVWVTLTVDGGALLRLRANTRPEAHAAFQRLAMKILEGI